MTFCMSLKAAALLAILSAPAFAADCSIDKAVYTVKNPDAEGFSLTFRPAVEPNAWSDLQATLTTPSREYKFSLTASNGYSYNYLVPAWKDAPEDADFHLFLFDKDLAVLDLPAKGKPAAHAILTPELGSWLYYGAEGETRDFLPVGMWTLAKCD